MKYSASTRSTHGRPWALLVLPLLVGLTVLLAAASALALPTGWVAGTVRDAKTNAPIQGIVVTLRQKSGNSWSQVNTGPTAATGRFTLSASPGTYRLDFTDNAYRYASEAWRNQRCIFTGDDITVSGGATRTCDATLGPAANIQVKLVTEATGGPVPNILPVGLYDRTASISSWIPSNALGIESFPSKWTGPYALVGNASTNFLAPLWSNDKGSSTFSVTSVPTTITITVRLRHKVGVYKDVVRVWGMDRFDSSIKSMVERSRTDVGWNVGDLVIVNGEDDGLVDALSASGLAGAFNAPILLTTAAALPPRVEALLRELPPGVAVHIVGGPGKVSANVVSQIRAALTGETVEQVYGKDKYATAAAVAARMKQKLVVSPTNALVANGENPNAYYDALALSPIAYARHYPILLVKATSVPASTTAALSALGSPIVIVAGGTSAVSTSVATSLNVLAGNRLAGHSKYDTARAVADRAVASGWLGSAQFGVASTLPDALSGAAVLGHFADPLLLSDGVTVPVSTSEFIAAHSGTLPQGWVFGGAGVFKESARLDMQDALNH